MPRQPPSNQRPRTREAPAQVLLRGLSVLESLNARTISSVEQVATDTHLPKATVVRMLALLVTKGYAMRMPARRGYQLGERVLALSVGYRSRDAIVDLARPHLQRFTAEHKWPVAIATLDVDAMRNRSSTLAESPFSSHLDQRRMARRVPLLASATGIAYLAFCPARERDTLLRLLASSRRERARSPRPEGDLDDRLRATAAQGYAPSPTLRDDPVRGFAVPVMVGDRVLACVTLRYFGRALTERQALKRYLEPLRAMAEAISRDYHAQQA